MDFAADLSVTEDPVRRTDIAHIWIIKRYALVCAWIGNQGGLSLSQSWRQLEGFVTYSGRIEFRTLRWMRIPGNAPGLGQLSASDHLERDIRIIADCHTELFEYFSQFLEVDCFYQKGGSASLSTKDYVPLLFGRSEDQYGDVT